jgi:putative oxidoreductase
MEIALLVLRLVVGLGIASHGAQKLFGWFGGYGLAGTGSFLESLGFRPGKFFAAVAGLAELGGGLLLVLGLGGPIGPMVLIATMLVASIAHKGFFAPQGFELALLYGALAFALAFTGFGLYSLDRALAVASSWTPVHAWAAVGLGILGGLVNIVALRRKPSPQPQAS